MFYFKHNCLFCPNLFPLRPPTSPNLPPKEKIIVLYKSRLSYEAWGRDLGPLWRELYGWMDGWMERKRWVMN